MTSVRFFEAYSLPPYHYVAGLRVPAFTEPLLLLCAHPLILHPFRSSVPPSTGHKSCMPTSVSTVADRLQQAGWATSAYGKWDMGMTSWGCTPTCRGFDHFFGFYNAFNDYFTHFVGAGLDLRNDTTPVTSERGQYFTEIVTTDVIRWLKSVVVPTVSTPGQLQDGKNTFVYLAHESNHAPLQVPEYYIDGGCADGTVRAIISVLRLGCVWLSRKQRYRHRF